MKENQRPPLPNRSNNSSTLSWRRDVSPDKKQSQRGIDPSSFHQSANRRPQQLRHALKEASTNVVRQRRSEVTNRLKLQRAAYKEVTSLKTWPLQDMAMKDLDHWMALHTGHEKEDTDEPHDEGDVETHGDSTGLSSSSLDEPKRTRRQSQNDALSPRKNTLRHQFKIDFLKERALIGSSQEFAQALWCMEPRIFAVEKSATGKRKYVVGHTGRFMDYYWRKVDPKQRHYYELIREKTPCRLYFDLEFSKVSNPEITESISEELLEEFIEELGLEFRRIYNLEVDRSCIVDLDSSTETKFSRHLIVHLANKALFADATAAGRFVRVLVGRLAEQAATGQLQDTRPMLAKYLFVNVAPSKKSPSSQESTISQSSSQSVTQSDKQESVVESPDTRSNLVSTKTCFVDMGVYTRNRLFRLLGSSKFGKPASAALRIAATNTFPFPQGFGNDSFYVPDMEKHVQETREKKGDNDDDDAEHLDMESEIKAFLSAVDWTDHATALGETLVVPINVSKLEFPILTESDQALSLDATTIGDTKDGPVSTPRSAITPALQIGPSPFPSVDDFVVNVLSTRGNVQGAIRAYSVEHLQGAPFSITYQMSRNRWCERLGRPHRSNNIMWTVNLQTMQCTQTCHDPECRALRFRGTPVDLPADIQEEISDTLLEQQLATMDEEALLKKQDDTKRQADFDEEEFERALLALNLNGDDESSRAHEPNSEAKLAQDDSNNAQEESPPCHTNQDTSETLADEALLDAMLSNPHLFP